MDELEQLRQPVLNGDKWAILDAMYLCCSRSIGAPGWLRDAYVKAYRNDVFGRRWKRKHLKSFRRRQRFELPVWHGVTLMRFRGVPVTVALEEVGKGFGFCKTIASELYYAMEKRDDIQQWKAAMRRLTSRTIPPKL